MHSISGGSETPTPEVYFDPINGHIGLEPYPAYALLREFEPVYYNPQYEFWALARYNDVRAASQDWETFSSAEGVELDDADELFGLGGDDFLASDPPKHDVLRGVVRNWFTPKAVAESKVLVQRKVSEILARTASWTASMCHPRSLSRYRYM